MTVREALALTAGMADRGLARDIRRVVEAHVEAGFFAMSSMVSEAAEFMTSGAIESREEWGEMNDAVDGLEYGDDDTFADIIAGLRRDLEAAKVRIAELEAAPPKKRKPRPEQPAAA